jgi:hypothetical protein
MTNDSDRKGADESPVQTRPAQQITQSAKARFSKMIV